MTKKKLPDLLRAPGDRVRHIAVNGGVERGGMDISYQTCADDDPAAAWLLTRDENGEPVKRRVKWTISQAE
jgi:hypothetical protein